MTPDALLARIDEKCCLIFLARMVQHKAPRLHRRKPLSRPAEMGFHELQLLIHHPREFDELGQRPAHGTEVAGWVGEAWNGAETESRNTPYGVFSPDR